jgi:hypothetical protein
VDGYPGDGGELIGLLPCANFLPEGPRPSLRNHGDFGGVKVGDVVMDFILIEEDKIRKRPRLQCSYSGTGAADGWGTKLVIIHHTSNPLCDSICMGLG